MSGAAPDVCAGLTVWRCVDGTLTEVGTLEEAFDVSWMKSRLDVGAATFSIPHDAPSLVTDPDLLTYGAMVAICVDEVERFVMLVRRRQRTAGDSYDTLTLTGPAVTDLLSDALVFPRGGIDAVGADDQRVFTWTTAEYDSSGWGDVSGPLVGDVLSTPGFPDPLAVGYEPIFPGGRALYRRLAESQPGLEGPARMVVVATVGTQVVVYLDGQEVLRKSAGQRGLIIADVDYQAYDQQIAVEVSGGTGRWGWTWVRLVEPEDEDGDLAYGTVIRRTFDPAVFPSAAAWKSFEAGGTDGWLAAAFDDSAWASPVVSSGAVSTAGWPDPAAIAYQSDTTWGHYRRKVGGDVAATPARLYVVATAQTQVRVYLDETEVLLKPSAAAGVFEAEVAYPAVEQQLAVAVIGSGRWALNWRSGADGSGSSLKRTYDPATTTPDEEWLYDPVPYPGVTFGSVLKTLIDEAQDRDALPCLTLGFDEDVDSDGNAWDEADWAVQVGDDTILAVCERARDYGIDVEIGLGETLTVDAWQRRGVDRGSTPAPATSTVTVPLSEAQHRSIETEDDVFDRLLLRTRWGWALRPALLTDATRPEGFVSLGMQPSEEGAVRLADGLIDEFRVPRPVVRWMWTQGGTGPEPGVAFGPGDTIVGPWLDPATLTGNWQSTDVRVNTIAGRVTDSGIVWSHEAGTP